MALAEGEFTIPESTWFGSVCSPDHENSYEENIVVLSSVWSKLGIKLNAKSKVWFDSLKKTFKKPNVEHRFEIPSFKGNHLTYRRLPKLPTRGAGFVPCIVEASQCDAYQGQFDVYVLNSTSSILGCPEAIETYEHIKYIVRKGAYSKPDAMLKLVDDIFELWYPEVFNEYRFRLVVENPDIVGLNGRYVYVKTGSNPPFPIGDHHLGGRLVVAKTRAYHKPINEKFYLRLDVPWHYTKCNGRQVVITEDNVHIVEARPLLDNDYTQSLDAMKAFVHVVEHHIRDTRLFCPEKYRSIPDVPLRQSLEYGLDTYNRLVSSARSDETSSFDSYFVFNDYLIKNDPHVHEMLRWACCATMIVDRYCSHDVVRKFHAKHIGFVENPADTMAVRTPL